MAGKFGSCLPCWWEEMDLLSEPPVHQAELEASPASCAVRWTTDFPVLGWRWVVEHTSSLTFPSRAGGWVLTKERWPTATGEGGT